jgi:hypothetical protein
MSTELDNSYIREIYSRMSDSELIYIITQDANGLSTDVREIIKEELESRRLDTGMLKSFDAQNKDYTPQEIDAYCEILRGLPCPQCGGVHEKLNGGMIWETISVIVFTYYTKRIVIACPSCLHSANFKATGMTLFLGWWGIPMGPIRTVISIYRNLKVRKAYDDPEPNFYLRSFTIRKVGAIEAYREDKARLQLLIVDDLTKSTERELGHLST